MSTMEHLFMQIFDTKQWIEGQLKHQVESYGESLAYNILAEGKQPPPWLWTTRVDGCGYLDPKGINTERLISGMLFPLPQTSTPSAINSAYFTLPAFMGDKVRQYNKFTETCTSNKYIFKEVPSASKVNPDRMAQPKGVEACAEFAPSAMIQHSTPRQRDQEIHLDEQEKGANHLGERNTKEGYIGRLTQSRAHPVKSDNVRESFAMNDSLHRQHTDGGRVTRSRSRSAAQPDCLDKSSESLKTLNCIEDDVYKGAEVQTETQSFPSVNLNHLPCTTTASNVRVSHTCTARSADMELGLDATSHVNSSLKMSRDVAYPLPDTLPLVVPKKLFFDGIEEHRSNRNSRISSVKINLLKSENTSAHCEVVQPVNKDVFHVDPEEVDDSEKDVLQHKMEVDVRVSNWGTEQDGLEMLEFDETESHSHPMSGQRSLLLDVNRNSSPDIVAEKQHSIKAKEVLMAGVDYQPHEIHSLVESKCPAPDSHKKSDLNINSVSAPAETKGSSSDIAFDKLKDLQSGKEASPGGHLQAHVSSMISQLQEAVLPSVEVVFEAEEANIVSGQVLGKRQELSEALESESILLSGSHNRNSDIPATSYLKITSGTCESSPTCLSPDAASTFKSDLDFADHQIFILHDIKKISLKTPVRCTSAEKNREKIIQETSSSPTQLMNIVQSAGSALSSQMDEVLEAETAALGVVKSILQPTVIPTMARTRDTTLEFHHRLRYSSSNGDKLGSCKLYGSALPFSDNVAVCLPALSKGSGSTMGITEVSVTKISSPAGTHNAQIKVPYSLRSSTRLSENLGSYLANGSVSCSKENSMLSEMGKNDISASLEDASEKSVNHKWITPNSTVTQGEPTKARYFLRSLSSQDKDSGSSRSSTSTYASCLKQAKETISHACEVSWPKRRKVEYRSTNILATSPRLRFNHSKSINEGSNCSYKIESGSVLEFQPTSVSAETKTGILNTAPETSSKSQHQTKKRSAIEGYSCLKENDNSVLTILPSEHTQEELLCDIADSKSQSCLRDETKVSEATICTRKKHYILEGCHDSLLEISKSRYNSNEFTQDRELCATEMGSHMHDTASSPHYDSDRVSFDQTMPEFEGFSIDFPSIMEDDTISNDSKLPTLAKERVSLLEQLCKSRNVLTPLSCTSSKYRIHKVPDVYQSLPAGLLEHMNVSCSLQFNDAEQFRESDNGNMGLQLDGSFVGRPYSYSMPSSSTRIDGEARKPPLTPQVMKFSQTVVSRQSGASSEKVGSNPELICFRIDENSSIPDESGHADLLDTSKEEISSRESKELTNRKALVDITAECQNEPILVSKSTKFLDRGSLESINSESYFRIQMSAQSSLARGHADHTDSKIEDKENTDATVNESLVRKAGLSLRNRSSKPRISGKINERSRSHGNLEKGRKPSNMVSNISSFVPLVHQKQQAAAPLKGRKDIKVKALEAAEAAKRLEEKKQNEREMRKAALKLEREKLEQENIRCLELKQKQKEEERKKKEADIAARKRQREEEGRKEKERKRRCIEETRRQKREQEEKSHSEKAEKEPRKEELGEEAKRQVKSEKGAEVVQRQTAAGMQQNNTKVLAVDDSDSNILEAPQCSQKSNYVGKVVSKSDSLREVLQTGISTNKGYKTSQSYEMSPYKTSDDEDGEEEIRREKKCIPLWARKECLDQVVLSKQHIDPTKIFSRKRSFILSDVLSTRILRRPF